MPSKAISTGRTRAVARARHSSSLASTLAFRARTTLRPLLPAEGFGHACTVRTRDRTRLAGMPETEESLDVCVREEAPELVREAARRGKFLQRPREQGVESETGRIRRAYASDEGVAGRRRIVEGQPITRQGN